MPTDTHGPDQLGTQDLLPLAALIAARAAEAPDASAIEAANAEPLRNRDLNALAESVHRTLRNSGQSATARVALTALDGPEFAAAAATIAAQAVCVPLNPGLGSEAWSDMLGALRVDALVAHPFCKDAVSAASAMGLPVLELLPTPEKGAGAFELVDKAKTVPNPGTDATPGLDDDAFVLPTSGTTARPKAVRLTHRNIAHSGRNTGAALGLTPSDRLIGVLPIHHAHGLISGLMATLHAGSSVIMLRGFSAAAFFEHLPRFRPTWLTAVPAIHQAILDAAPAHQSCLENHSLRLIRSASAPMSGPRFDALADLFGVPILETYGMTEAASQIASTPLDDWRRKPGSVGTAAGPDITILDDNDKPVPPEQVGQIALRGPNMTLGYDDPAATAAAFTRTGWFRTGDLGRLDEDGFLYIVGRLKEVINRGGTKILPGRIEAVLNRHPAVKEAAAFAAPHPRLGEDVAAAIVAAEQSKTDEASLRRFALDSGKLSDAEVPRRIVFVDALPKTLTGKIQRAQLAERLGLKAPMQKEPATAEELTIVEIWKQVMGRDAVGATDDFFHLGGDSLMAVEIALRLEEVFGVNVTLRAFFEAPTPRALASLIQTTGKRANAFSIERSQRGVMQKPVSFSQDRMLSMERALPGLPTNTVPIVYFLDGPFDPKVFEKALRAFIARHEIFRSVYRNVAGDWVAIPTGTVNLRVPVEDWQWARALPHDSFILDALETEVWDVLDPTKAAPFRTRLLRLDKERHVVILMYHHVAMDNWTIRLFLEEVFQHYCDIQAGRALSLPKPRIQFSDFAAWQRDWTKGQTADAQRSYWAKTLGGLEAVLPERTENGIGFGTGRADVALPKDTVDLLAKRSKATGATLFMGLIAALKVFLHARFKREDITIVVPTANRSRPATGDVAGPVANNAAIRTGTASLGFDATLDAVRGAVLEADAKQELPFEIVMDDLKRADPKAAAALSDIYLSLVDTFEPEIDGLGLTLARMAEDQAFETPMPLGTTKLMFLLKLVNGAILGTCIYKPLCFEPAEIDDMLDAFSDSVLHMVESRDSVLVD